MLDQELLVGSVWCTEHLRLGVANKFSGDRGKTSTCLSTAPKNTHKKKHLDSYMILLRPAYYTPMLLRWRRRLR